VTHVVRPADEIFLALANLDPDARAAFLDERCGRDPRLRAEVEALLDALDAPDDGFLDPANVPSLDAAAVDGPLQPGTSLGEFLVLHAIGSGGMGVVYAAQQDRPRRTVAIKVLRRGFRHPEILKRFEREAELLGRLQHQGIAQVFAFHAGDRRVPAHLVMELVTGPPITEYVQARGLGLAARLALMTDVCEAVQHAHDRGVVHRDLKPANVLVSEDGQPKVLDFGIARAMGLGVSTLQTAHGQLLGTLAFMSPEQLRGAAELVDGRSDVYALGVIFYRLMAGRLPFDVGDLRLVEAAQRILNAHVPPLGSLHPDLGGAIELIAARAMAPDRAQRYQSAADMAADLRACREGRQPQHAYRTGGVAGAPASRLVTAENADGRLVAIGLASGTVVILESATGAQIAKSPGDGMPVEHLAFEHGGRLAIRRAGGRLELIDVPALV
jgi:non-specific serine/threonine protein kinase/serine/threonine-protein kinase